MLVVFETTRSVLAARAYRDTLRQFRFEEFAKFILFLSFFFLIGENNMIKSERSYLGDIFV